jgi:hypothetical protein
MYTLKTGSAQDWQPVPLSNAVSSPSYIVGYYVTYIVNESNIGGNSLFIDLYYCASIYTTV